LIVPAVQCVIPFAVRIIAPTACESIRIADTGCRCIEHPAIIIGTPASSLPPAIYVRCLAASFVIIIPATEFMAAPIIPVAVQVIS